MPFAHWETWSLFLCYVLMLLINSLSWESVEGNPGNSVQQHVSLAFNSMEVLFCFFATGNLQNTCSVHFLKVSGQRAQHFCLELTK